MAEEGPCGGFLDEKHTSKFDSFARSGQLPAPPFSLPIFSSSPFPTSPRPTATAAAMPPRRTASQRSTREEAAAQLLLLAESDPGALPIPTQQHDPLPIYQSTQCLPAEDFSLPVPALHHEPLPVPPSSFALFSQQNASNATTRKRQRQRKTHHVDTAARSLPSATAHSGGCSLPVESSAAAVSTRSSAHEAEELAAFAFGDHEGMGMMLWDDYSDSNHQQPVETSEQYARMFFNDNTAYVARVDLRTWALEHVYDGAVQVSIQPRLCTSLPCASH